MKASPGESFRIRLATPADVQALEALIDLSVRTLQAGHYSATQIDGALGTLLGLDTQLIRDGTFFVAEVRHDEGGTVLAGCGGWSKRKTLFGGDHGPVREDSFLEPGRHPAKIRAFFIHPDWARRRLRRMDLG